MLFTCLRARERPGGGVKREMSPTGLPEERRQGLLNLQGEPATWGSDKGDKTQKRRQLEFNKAGDQKFP